MGIRQKLNSVRESWDPTKRKPLTLTEGAQEFIRKRVADAPEEDLVFFVLTQPSQLGFNVGVGFEPRASAKNPLREEYDVPVVISDEDLDRLLGFTVDYRDERFVTLSDVTVHMSETPNPESRKFILNRDLITEGSATFTRPVKEDVPPLVRVLMEIPQVKSLFFIKTFCTVTRMADAAWDTIQMDVGKHLQGYFAHGGTVMTPPPADDQDRSEIEQKIIQVLEDVVRPAVQKDGGDIVFAGYDDGTVQLYMLGSCVGCPSSLATLKIGVENLLKDAVPEVREVVQID